MGAAGEGAAVSDPLVAALLALMVVLAIAAVRAGDLLVAAITLGVYGSVMALTWAAIGADDVSFTETVVGAGATTVFFLAALLRTSRRRSPAPGTLRWGALVIVASWPLRLMIGRSEWYFPIGEQVARLARSMFGS